MKEGFGLILGHFLLAAVLTLGTFFSPFLALKIMAGLGWALFAFTLFFFRDPERPIPRNDRWILSPADGRVVEIERVREGSYLQAEATKVSIFMSIFDVHINRVPMSGKVGFFQYNPGGFRPAYKAIASASNEQTSLGIENDRCKILVKQIAGVLARRIVCHLREGHRVTQGERFGMIRFGSRVEVFLPLTVEVKVSLHDKVKGGISVLGEIKNP